MVVTVQRVFFLSTKTGKNTKIKPAQSAREESLNSSTKKWAVMTVQCY